MLLQPFFSCSCPYNDKLVLHCINDILMDFLGSNEISYHRIWRIESFFIIFKCIKGEVLRHLSHKGQSNKVK